MKAARIRRSEALLPPQIIEIQLEVDAFGDLLLTVCSKGEGIRLNIQSVAGDWSGPGAVCRVLARGHGFPGDVAERVTSLLVSRLGFQPQRPLSPDSIGQ